MFWVCAGLWVLELATALAVRCHPLIGCQVAIAASVTKAAIKDDDTQGDVESRLYCQTQPGTIGHEGTPVRAIEGGGPQGLNAQGCGHDYSKNGVNAGQLVQGNQGTGKNQRQQRKDAHKTVYLLIAQGQTT